VLRLLERGRVTASGTVAGLVVGAALATVLACGAAGRPMAAAPGGAPSSAPVAPSAMPAAMGSPGELRAQITALDRDLAARRSQMGLAAPDAGALEVAGTPMAASRDPACHPGTGQVCRDTCGLADAICDDATRICALADGLPGDAWASGRCSEGQASCAAAYARCCGCR
jgi:hypothetical protein